VDIEISPEPSEEERQAILAALQEAEDGTSGARKPWLREGSEP
jgi:hypothetical protein